MEVRGSLIRPHGGRAPVVPASVFVAPTAVVVGDVVLGEESSVWFGAVVRGDVGRIRVGARTNIQDHCMLHLTGGRSDLAIGEEVTVGHRAILHGAAIGDRCLIGMGAIVLDDSVVGEESLVGAGSVLREGTIVPPADGLDDVGVVLDDAERGSRGGKARNPRPGEARVMARTQEQDPLERPTAQAPEGPRRHGARVDVPRVRRDEDVRGTRVRGLPGLLDEAVHHLGEGAAVRGVPRAGDGRPERPAHGAAISASTASATAFGERPVVSITACARAYPLSRAASIARS